MPSRKPPAFDPLRFVDPGARAKSRAALIAEIAYFKAQSRGFEPGHEEEDWLAAEAEVDKRPSGSRS
jgi:Protein of unknown function (DUF2934)